MIAAKNITALITEVASVILDILFLISWCVTLSLGGAETHSKIHRVNRDVRGTVLFIRIPIHNISKYEQLAQ